MNRGFPRDNEQGSAQQDSTNLGDGVPEWSIVSTMYRSHEFLSDFLDQCLEVLARMQVKDFEIVLVNDGSPDDSLAYAKKRQQDIPQLVVVDLSRNFGHHNAMQAGLQISRGARIFLIDCDLEVSPTTLAEFDAKQRKTEAEVVFGFQELRKGSLFERLSGVIFWKGFNSLSDTKIPESILTERIMTRRYLNSLLTLGDHNLFLAGMMSWAGFHQVGLSIAKRQRHGQSTYTLRKRVQLLVNAISSFSPRPLTWMFNAGIFITSVSFVYVLYIIFRKIAFGDSLVGFTSLMALMAITLGVLTTGLGLVGIYLGKVFSQVQGRPDRKSVV